MILPLSSFGAGTYVHPERVDIGAPKRPERLKTKGIGQKRKAKNSVFQSFRLCFALFLWFLAVCSQKAVTKVRPLCECTPLAPYASKLMSAKKNRNMPPDLYQAAHSDQDESKHKKRYDNSLIIKLKTCLFRKKIVSLYCN